MLTRLSIKPWISIKRLKTLPLVSKRKRITLPVKEGEKRTATLADVPVRKDQKHSSSQKLFKLLSLCSARDESLLQKNNITRATQSMNKDLQLSWETKASCI